jgi:hypothetical protein
MSVDFSSSYKLELFVEYVANGSFTGSMLGYLHPQRTAAFRRFERRERPITSITLEYPKPANIDGFELSHE